VISKTIEFFKNSYRESPVAFYAEMLEAILLIGASAVLAFTILDPATRIFVPMYLLGSILGIVSAVKRRAAFVIVLCTWFTMMNLISFVQLFILN
jgi:hypothetical protein